MYLHEVIDLRKPFRLSPSGKWLEVISKKCPPCFDHPSRARFYEQIIVYVDDPSKLFYPSVFDIQTDRWELKEEPKAFTESQFRNCFRKHEIEEQKITDIIHDLMRENF